MLLLLVATNHLLRIFLEESIWFTEIDARPGFYPYRISMATRITIQQYI